MEKTKSCCDKGPPAGSRGILYGILPHSFCIAFIIFSVIGATAATTIFKSLLLLPYFFQILIGISLLFATISAAIYLKKLNMLNLQGIKGKWRYLSLLFGTAIAVNLFFFFVVFPWTANLKSRSLVDGRVLSAGNLNQVSLKVQVPCSGHAPLIIDELNKEAGVNGVFFKLPNIFDIEYDSQKTSPEDLLLAPIFKEFPAAIVKQ